MKKILNFINGEMVASERSFELRTPISNAVIGHVSEASAAQVDQAVMAAKAALTGPWSKLSVAERAEKLYRVADDIDAWARRGETMPMDVDMIVAGTIAPRRRFWVV